MHKDTTETKARRGTQASEEPVLEADAARLAVYTAGTAQDLFGLLDRMVSVIQPVS
ncbi:hypothetical protein [Nonomuraea sp. B19D2]|uniref:hypothetical protein n=1 Tax=Nonomuraea sp. B19D2 TaxID=3159561 RepID=UPI0032DB6F2B